CSSSPGARSSPIRTRGWILSSRAPECRAAACATATVSTTSASSSRPIPTRGTDMNRFVHAFMRFAAVALLATAFPAAASIHAPDHVDYGGGTLVGMPAPNGTTVELGTVSDNAVLARYVVGSNSHLGGL